MYNNDPNKHYPSNMGKKWSIEEDNLLSEELDKNIDITIIAQTHNRTVGGITGRQRDIAYKMHLNDIPIEEIIIKTKLNMEQITDTITKKENKKIVNVRKTPTIESNKFSLENEVTEMRRDIKELKNTIKELVKMMKCSELFEK